MRAEVRQAALGVELLAGQRVVVTARPAKLRRSGDGVRAGEGARVLHVQIVIHELPVGRVHASAVVDGRAGAVAHQRHVAAPVGLMVVGRTRAGGLHVAAFGRLVLSEVEGYPAPR